MSQLDQIQISFAAAEDRLLMRVSTQASEEFRFWLTRRFVKALRPALGQSLTVQPRIKTQPDPVVKQELLRFDHEVAVQGSDFQTPYKGTERALPLGEQPLLLTRLQVRARADGGIVLVVGPAAGSTIDIALTPQLIHSFVALLEHALQLAQWDLEPAAPEAPAAATPASIN